INGAAAPLAPTAAAPGAATAGAKPPGKRESTTNYEVDKTVKTTRGAVGQVRRLSAAVVVNYQNVADAQGKPGATPTALSAQQIEQMTALIRETIGFSKERGDSVNLMNTPFLVPVDNVVEVPLWKRPELLDLARSFAWPLGLTLLGLIVLFGMVRPGIKAMRLAAPPPVPATAVAALDAPGSNLDALLSEEPQRPALGSPQQEATALPGPSQESLQQQQQSQVVPEQARLEGARQMARQNPVAVANIVKSWVNGDAAASA
ncbi:MAG: hypothetical protein EOP73_18550, partial [Variovorax sp.]